MATLKESFESLKRTGVNYCVISDYTSLPEMTPTRPLEILTTSPDEVVGVMGLFRKGHPEQFVCTDNPQLMVHVYAKGKGVFPDVFESALLARHTFHNQIVRIPSFDEHALMVLYRNIFHWDGYKEEPWMRRSLAEYMRRKTGNPRRTRYKTLGFTP